MTQTKPNASMAIVVGMLSDRTGLWQVTPERVSLLRGAASSLSMRSKAAAEDMLKIAASGERFWQPNVDSYFALNEIKMRSMGVDKKTVDLLISEVVACARRDGVAHREWVKNVVDVLSRISSEK